MTAMDLERYDGQCVRITDLNGDVFDGICFYNNSAYNEHEFGCCEDSLQIVNFNFYRSDIKEIESLEDHSGPYGKFLDPFGKLEEMNVEDGIDSIQDVLFCEEHEHILRMLRCLDHYFDPQNHRDFSCRKETCDALLELENFTDDETVKKETNRLLAKWGQACAKDNE